MNKTQIRTYHLSIPHWYLNDQPAEIIDADDLADHFNDLYQLFLYKLTNISFHGRLSEAEEKKLRSLFDELIQTRQRIEELNHPDSV
jgi:hypothetical protein